MEIDGVSYDVWADTKYNLSDIDDKFGGLMSVVRFATTLLVYLALIRYLVNTYHRIFGISIHALLAESDVLQS